MTRPHQRALAWLARHPTVLVVAVAFTASVAVAAVGDLSGVVDSGFVAGVDTDSTEVGSVSGGPNDVGDN